MSFKKLYISALITVFSLAGIHSAVFAQDDAGEANGGSGLRIIETKTEKKILAGDETKFSFKIQNITKNSIKAEPFINDFESDNTTGNPKIIVDPSQKTAYSISNMIKGLETLSLKPGEIKEVSLIAQVPDGATPGAYFGAIRYAAIPEGLSDDPAQRQVALTASVAHLVFIEVSGEIIHQIQINSLKAQKDESPATFFISQPDKMALSVSNLGNGFSRPLGQVFIKNMFGKEVYQYQPNNTTPRGIVLPKSSRTFVDDIKNISQPGRYSAVASIAYGDGEEIINYETSFWYLPVWFLLSVLTILIVIAGGIYYFAIKRRK